MEKNYKDLRYKKLLKTSLGLMPDWNPAEIIGFKPNHYHFQFMRIL